MFSKVWKVLCQREWSICCRTSQSFQHAIVFRNLREGDEGSSTASIVNHGALYTMEELLGLIFHRQSCQIKYNTRLHWHFRWWMIDVLVSVCPKYCIGTSVLLCAKSGDLHESLKNIRYTAKTLWFSLSSGDICLQETNKESLPQTEVLSHDLPTSRLVNLHPSTNGVSIRCRFLSFMTYDIPITDQGIGSSLVMPKWPSH